MHGPVSIINPSPPPPNTPAHHPSRHPRKLMSTAAALTQATGITSINHRRTILYQKQQSIVSILSRDPKLTLPSFSIVPVTYDSCYTTAFSCSDRQDSHPPYSLRISPTIPAVEILSATRKDLPPTPLFLHLKKSRQQTPN